MKALLNQDMLDKIAVELARQLTVEYGEPHYVVVGSNRQWDIISESKKHKILINTDNIFNNSNSFLLHLWSRKNRNFSLYLTKASHIAFVMFTENGLEVFLDSIKDLKEFVKDSGKLENYNGNVFSTMEKSLAMQTFYTSYKINGFSQWEE